MNVGRGIFRYFIFHLMLVHVGQFWGVPFTVVDTAMDGENYTLTIHPPQIPGQDAPMDRTFPAMLGPRTWSLNHEFAIPGSKCLYAGDGQGGPENENVDSVIQGNYTHYITDDLFSTEWAYSRYTAATCP